MKNNKSWIILLLYNILITIILYVCISKYNKEVTLFSFDRQIENFYSYMNKNNVYFDKHDLSFLEVSTYHPAFVSGYVQVSFIDKPEYWKNGYKSKYFNIKDEIQNYTFDMFIEEFGYKPYFLYKILNDKTRGNDIENIEKQLNILEKNYKLKISFSLDYAYKIKENNKLKSEVYLYNKYLVTIDNGFINYTNSSMYNELDKKYVKNRNEKMKQYFSKPRNFKEIDWSQYFDFIELIPVLKIDVKSSLQLEKQVYEEIRKIYKSNYNTKTYLVSININK